jgi:hypothetical protein
LHPRFRDTRFKYLINVYFLLVILFAVLSGLVIPRMSRDWIIGDWLINYQGGFVRRGLPGEVVYLVGHLVHVSPIHLIVALYLILTLIYLLAFRSLALGASKRYWVAAILLSPATLGFQVLHVQAGFRKEYIYLAALSGFLLLLRRQQFSDAALSIYMAACLVLAVFSHESTLFYAPYFLVALVFSGRSVVEAVKVCAIPFLLTLIAALLCMSHMGNAQQVGQICSSLGYGITSAKNDVCSSFGAINYLSYTREMARADTLSVMRQYQYLRIYPLLAVLSLLPVMVGSRALAKAGQADKIRVLQIVAAISILGSLALFFYAIDWGRWISMHVVSMSLLLLFLDGRRQEEAASLPVSYAPRRTPMHKFAFTAMVVAYATLWSLPHFIKEPVRLGYYGLIHDTLHQKDRRKHAPALPVESALSKNGQ